MGLYDKIGLRFLALRLFSFVNLTRHYNLKTALNVTCKQILSRFVSRKDYKIFIFGQNIQLRKNNTDEIIFDQIFSEQQYTYSMNSKEAKIIIDAGANIGLAAVFFKKKYPQAKIISIEPDKDNFAILEFNTQFHSDRELINGALWDKSGIVEISNPESAPSSFVVTEQSKRRSPVKIRAYTVDEIIHLFKIEKIDILKIDIEGAEEHLFKENYKNWLDKTSTLIIELHDQYISYSSASFFKAIEGYKFNFEVKGENLIFHFDH